MDIQAGGYTLRGLQDINIILGKNGCGKSTLLKAVDQQLAGTPEYGSLKYITPERGGVLVYEPNVDGNMANSAGWLQKTRRNNQFGQFREQTVSQYRTLETQVLRLVQGAYKSKSKNALTFDTVLEQINELLDNIRIEDGTGPIFRIVSKATGEELKGKDISSGESELISLAIECLTFSRSLKSEKLNILILDEPDVHLHPDLQGRLTRFLKQLVQNHKFTVLMATHSTAMLGDLATEDSSAVALMQTGDKELKFRGIDETYRRILPVFGAHPLSNIFNEAPLLLVEGEDDVRIWQQAVRSGLGKLRVYPVECGTVNQLNEHETLAAEIVSSIYDDARAYSLRDRDEGEEEIENLGPVTRMRLHCRAAENLMLSDDVLMLAKTNWPSVESRIIEWLDSGQTHVKRHVMEKFRDGGFDRIGFDLKEIRLILVGTIMESNKPWEVLVGRAIGNVTISAGDHSLSTYLGDKVCRQLLS